MARLRRIEKISNNTVTIIRNLEVITTNRGEEFIEIEEEPCRTVMRASAIYGCKTQYINNKN